MQADFSASQDCGRNSPMVIEQDQPAAACRTAPTERVGGLLTDAGRETAIRGCGLQMLAWMAEYERTGCFSARGTADFWRGRMQEFVAGRSADRVRAMEAERGLV